MKINRLGPLMTACLAFLTGVCAYPDLANAATISAQTIPIEGTSITRIVVVLRGAIEVGDVDRLLKVLREAKRPTGLDLDSPGGSVTEAINLGEIVAWQHLTTRVAKGGKCASSCFFVWLNGEPRDAAGDDLRDDLGPVGLHRPYLQNPDASAKSLATQRKAMQLVDSYLASKLIPRRLIEIAMHRASNEIYWMTRDDLDELGFYSIEADELHIAKCGTSWRAIEAAKAASRDSMETSRLNKVHRTFMDCERTISQEATGKARSELERGEVPELPFKQ